MNQTCQFSNNTRQYLTQFYGILDRMIAGMTGVELTGSISHDFIVRMIPHHRAAIEMSQNLLLYTTNIPLQNIALRIIQSQTESIEQMQAALPCCSKLCDTEQDLCLYRRRIDQIMSAMFTRMGTAGETNCINADFMREMIPHHQGAILMSENALRYPLCPELIPILDAIIKSQRRGVREMEQLLRCMR